MDDEFLNYYNEELKFIREMSGEFARDFPKVAGRLSLDAMGQDVCADPFVERLLEGFSFLTARIRQKQDSEFPNWTQAFFESVYPTYPNPLPSMGVVKFSPDLSQGDLAEGLNIPKGTRLNSKLLPGEKTPCSFMTGHSIDLHPLKISSAEYYDRTLDQLGIDEDNLVGVRAGVCLRFETTSGSPSERLPVAALVMDHLDLHLCGSGDISVRIFEYLLSKSVRILLRPIGASAGDETVLESSSLSPIGMDKSESLLPPDARVFEGYRILREYFSCPKRFLFLRLSDIADALSEMSSHGFEVVFLLSSIDDYIQKYIDVDNFDLFCVPAINLFEKRLDRVNLSYSKSEYAIVPDKTRPYDFEVFSLERVVGIGRTSKEETQFYPFYRVTDRLADADAYFTTRREVRRLSDVEERIGKKSSYLGSQLWVSLVDRNQLHLESNLRQLSISAMCTNRHLPLSMAKGEGSSSDFEVEMDLVENINFLGSPTVPRPALDEGSLLWRMVNHLHSNYHSIIDDDIKSSGQALRDVLRLFAESTDVDLVKQVDALEEVRTEPITRRFYTEGPVSFVRGHQISLVFNEQTFGDSGIYLLGQLIAEFLRRYVMINAFVETVLISKQRGEIKRWAPKTGSKTTL
ncbi:MAG: type VI secretion system baseplate subunit TssF [Opitutaceae bacterium]